MPGFDNLRDYNESIHGSRSDEWEPQPDFLGGPKAEGTWTTGPIKAMVSRSIGSLTVTCGDIEYIVEVNRVRFAGRHAKGYDAFVRYYRNEAINPNVYLPLAKVVHAQLARDGWSTDRIQSLMGGGGIATHLRWYGLTESRLNSRGVAETRSGFYRPTREGGLVYEGFPVPTHLHMFNGVIERVSKKVITLDEAWSIGFDVKDTFPIRKPLIPEPQEYHINKDEEYNG